MSAADKLQSLDLPNGWKVVRHLARNPNGTGGTFSQSYVVEKDGKEGFLKAFDFWQAFEAGVDTSEAIQILTSAYNYEREVLAHCGDRGLSNVVLAIDHGSVQVPDMGAMEGRVFYLIFEMAAGDVRVQMDVKKAFDAVWCVAALRDISLGLWQVHREMIAHQDAKPSNVLTYAGPVFKVADFGRSSRRGRPAPHDHLAVAGDGGYAPPELLYGFVHPEFIPRRVGCDLYMLGNLAAFLFSGVNMTARLLAHLDPQQHPDNWNGTYEGALPYLSNAFTSVLKELQPLIDERIRSEVMDLIRQLCDPNLSQRGHPRGLGRHSQYSLERYVSQLDLLAKKLAIRIRIEKAA
ncbi:serine/threonine-protein kinase [Mesorhizobium sp. M0870]|uniref:serine/threonine-protein kinase n=1 Tax=Mesorhizobium sp. M0870 TaxID=2957016 RepID=UPI00333B89BE